jgi:7-cyano-7-deazaguanine synthase
MTKALVVLSGGQDSTTCLFWAKKHYEEVHAVTFDYGQRHVVEIDAARTIAATARIASHEIIDLPNCLVSTSPLTSDKKLEKYESFEQMDKVIGDRVELTFVPMRNTLFLTVAANRAVALGCTDIVTGVCQQDNANYPDCRTAFINAMELTINESLGTGRMNIVTPLIMLTKAESIAMATKLPGCMEALAYSHTSYDGKYPPTDMNHANVLRAKGFEDAGIADPLVIRAFHEGLMSLPATRNYDAYRQAGE